MQFGVQLIEVLRCPRVGVGGSCTLDEGVEFHEGVGAQCGRLELLGGVGGAELGGEVREVGESEFAGVRVRNNADVDY